LVTLRVLGAKYADLTSNLLPRIGKSRLSKQLRRSAIIDIFGLSFNTIQKVGCLAAYTDRSCPELSAYMGDVFLGICVCRDRLLRRQLKHRCRLTLTQDRQQLDSPIWEFERIVMRGWLFLVDLPKDCRPVVGCLPLPPEKNHTSPRTQ
jgi:hypothetical protein